MTHIHVLSAALLLALALPATAKEVQSGEDGSEVNKSLEVPAGRQVGDLSSVNGSIRIEDDVKAGEVETVNGAIRLGDRVAVKSVEVVNGSVRAGDELVVERGVETVNGSLEFGPGLRAGGDVESVNGGIRSSRCAIDGAVETVNGSIDLSACQIAKNIETVTGNVTLQDGTVLLGDLIVSKPNNNWGWGWGNKKRREPVITLGENVVVKGVIRFEQPVKLVKHPTAKTGEIQGEFSVLTAEAAAPAQ